MEIIADLPPFSELKILDLSRNIIKFIIDNAFRNLASLTELYLQHNMLDFTFNSVPRSVFYLLTNMQILDISSNRLAANSSSYRDDLFRFNNSLDNLTMDSLPLLPFGKGFANLISLRHLTIKHNLVSLTNETFKHLKDVPLERLSIMSCCLAHVEAETFSPLSHMSELELSDLPYLKLTSASRAWPGLRHTSIRKLSISGVGGLTRNHLERVKLDEEIYQGWENTNITELRMNSNYILQIDASTLWKYLPNLEVLTVAHNSVAHIVPLVGSLHPLQHLTYLDASMQHRTSYATGPDFSGGMCNELINNIIPSGKSPHVAVTKIPNHTIDSPVLKTCEILRALQNEPALYIDYPPALEHYNLSYDVFRNRLPKHYLCNTLNLKYIGFAGNGVEYFETEVVLVNRSKHNITVDVSDNGIVSISREFFTAGSNFAETIETFIMKKNKLGTLIASRGCDFIQNITYLKHVDLSDNLIKTLPKGSFNGLQFLEHIILSNNALRTFKLDLGIHSNLKTLDLSNNLIASLSYAIMHTINSLASVRNPSDVFHEHAAQSITVNILDNPLICSCNTETIHTLDTKSRRYIDNNYDPF